MRSTLPALALGAALLAACGGDDDAADRDEARDVTAAGEHVGHPTTPARGWDRGDPAELERGRLDRSWRTPAEADLAQRRAGRGSAAAPGAGVRDTSARDTPASNESWDDIAPSAVNDLPTLPLDMEEGGPSTLRIQVMLDRANFSPGVIDGRWGKNTEKAVYWFQSAQDLEATGEVDGETYERLLSRVGESPPLQRKRLTGEDVEGPFVQIPEDVYELAE
ncbi:MAG TPA: peptidoglycan-binding domain-containing protein, partial [Longimicrobiales bacterium]|nr:peptidoglycan-binding domain-containing protein [Longimicrobiales bacterium]